MDFSTHRLRARMSDQARRRFGHTVVIGLALAAATGAAGLWAADDKDAPAPPAAKPGIAAIRRQSTNKMKQLALAMHNYHATYGSFPPAAISGADGKPLLSWRVVLLPFLEESTLFKEFNLNEPWDSEHNKQLLSRMPKVFDVEFEGKKPGETIYVGLAGKNTVFDGKTGVKLTDITDGTSNTIMLVESARPVPWTKPEDLPYDADKPLPALRHLGDGFITAFCDGSVRFISAKVPEKTLRVLITRNDGEVPGKF